MLAKLNFLKMIQLQSSYKQTHNNLSLLLYYIPVPHLAYALEQQQQPPGVNGLLIRPGVIGSY